jgi:hypothetical protein
MSRAAEQAERFRNTPCPRPMSRNKMRSAMWLNRKDLTGEKLCDTMGRAPGMGRFKCKLMEYEAKLQKQERKEVNETAKEKISAVLTQLRNFLKPRVGAVRMVKAARAS